MGLFLMYNEIIMAKINTPMTAYIVIGVHCYEALCLAQKGRTVVAKE